MADRRETKTNDPHVLENVYVATAQNPPSEILSAMFYEMWHAEGLCASLTEAQTTLSRLNSRFAYMAADAGVPYALMHTQPMHAGSISELLKISPTYQSVLDLSASHFTPENPNIQLCFSIVARPGFRVRTGKSDDAISRFLITHAPRSPDVYQIAFSRFSHVPTGEDPFAHFQKHLREPKVLGPVGMHMHYDGLPVAIQYHSRPADAGSAGANVLVVYPRNHKEHDVFATIHDGRIRSQKIPTVRDGNSLLFIDATGHLSFS
jgi:hypothetical protein